MENNKYITYLIKKGVFKEIIACEPITLGASGAKLFTINDGNICDWQGLNIGKSVGDISFFISRGMGFGIPMDEEILLNYYCERL